jgi:hypothetical protein
MINPPEPDPDPVSTSAEIGEQIHKLLHAMRRLQEESERLGLASEELRRTVKLPANGAGNDGADQA